MRRKGEKGKEGRVKWGGTVQDETERGRRKGGERKEGRNGAG